MCYHSESCAELYQWTDTNGSVHFSDNPMSVPKGKRPIVRQDDKAGPPPSPLQLSSTTTLQNTKQVTQASPVIKADEIKPEKYKRGSAEFVTLERQLSTTWNNMRQALKVRNIEGALAYFTESTRDSFRDQFTAMKKDLPEIAKEMGEARLVKFEEDSIAECDIRRVENGETYSFMLQFVRDYDGIWRIRTF
jgi:hypothetical protein